jgi:hypothetical protein
VIEFDVNEKFNALAEVLARRGMKAPLLQCWMDMDPQTRVKYRMIKNVFRDVPGSSTAQIYIEKDERKAAMEPGVFARIKKFVKKLLVVAAVVGAARAATKSKDEEDK